jgi:hypothetical protein
LKHAHSEEENGHDDDDDDDDDLQMEEEFENSQIKTKHYKERTATIKTVFSEYLIFFTKN